VSRGRRRRLRDDRGGDGGYAIALVALSLIVIIAMAAFSVDVSNWYLNGQREQRAADAAALAGVVFLPQDVTTASNTASATALLNGYGGSAPCGSNTPPCSVTVDTVPNHTNQLKVTVTNKVTNFFGPVLGVGQTAISRSAVAEYQGPVPMGSPVNGMGNEVVLTCNRSDFPVGATGTAQYNACVAKQESSWVTSNGQANFWMHISSPQRAKSTGDAYQSFNCSTSDSNCPGGTNTDYQGDGYFYIVHNPNTSGTLQFQAFDPAAIDVGDNCTSANLNGASAIDPNKVPDAIYRYASGATSPFCTGDSGGDGVTTFIVRAPDSTPWSYTDNPVLCTKQFSGFSGALVNYLTPGTAEYTQVQPDGHTIAQEFRQWVNLCTVASPVVGDYVVQVRTDVALNDPLGTLGLVTNANSSGNRFAIRAAITNGGAMPGTTGSASGISIYAAGRLGIYANETGAQTNFYFARVTPDAAGRTLNLNFFDTGDASQPGQIQILGPGIPTPSSLSGCVYSGPTGPDLTQVANSCIINPVTSATMNGQWMTMAIQIPSNYTCTVSNSLDCWFQVKFTYPNGTSVQDTTSWSANLNGDPVRLVG